jgi:hypothetical protein
MHGFDATLRKDALPIFMEVLREVPDKRLRFELSPQLKRNLEYIRSRYYKDQEIDTQKKLAELPVRLIGQLLQKSEKFQINPDDKDFFPKLRSLIIATIDVQWIGVKVSELWAAAIY